MHFPDQSNVDVFKSLFKGREDVFAVRWEKGNKSGYMPAYFYDPYRLRVHKMNCGTFQNFSEKSLNKEVIEGVKFQFLNKGLLKQFTPKKQNILTSDELQERGKIYANAEELLNEILKNKQYKHSQHIQYLADRHESRVMKIRFVLNPFSFLFLLVGEQSYFIVLETLDTEEATYIWHTPKYKATLIEEVKQIDNQLSIIREKGRQAFLEINPENFIRILHDYSDNKKGFILWKSAIEELI
jgi:hypothetical protein